MAVKKSDGKKNSAEKSKKSGSKGKKSSWFVRTVKRMILLALLTAAGGFIFQFGCMENVGISMLKYKKYLPTWLVKVLPGSNAEQGRAVAKEMVEGKVLEVYDGDTIDILTADNKKYRIRFFGIDAPEKLQPYGIEARDLLRQKILGKNVTAAVINTDNYGRSVAKVMLAERYINLEMVADGAAWHYAAYAKNEDDIAAAEKNARIRNLGIWRDPYPQPPWEWRRVNKK